MAHSSLILIAHGSKDPRWRIPFEKLEKQLKDDLGADGVYLSYMEFVEPTIMNAAKSAVAAGASKVTFLPLFMAGGAHLDKDVPPMVEAVKKEFPKLSVDLLGPIGEHPKFEKLIYQIALEAA